MKQQLNQQTQGLVLSYLGVRRAIGAVGLLLPILLGPLGWLIFGVTIQDNMSSYYHTPMRDVFVGSLCAIGIFLFCYRGHDWVESCTANLGCLSALGIAFFPLDAHSDPLYQSSIVGYLHTLSGGTFFLTLSFYSLYHFPSSNSEKLKNVPHEVQRNFVYRTSGTMIVASLVAMGTYFFLLPSAWKTLLNNYHFLFWMEWVAVWSFAAAWLTKGRDLFAEFAVEMLAISGELLLKRDSTVGGQPKPSPPHEKQSLEEKRSG